MDSHSQTREHLCWFCSKRPSEGKATVVIHLTRTTPIKSTTVNIPRCYVCKHGHEDLPDALRKIASYVPVLAIGMAILGGLFLVLREEGRQRGWVVYSFLIGAIASIALLAVVVPLFWLLERLYRSFRGIRDIKKEVDYDAVQRLTSRRWQVNIPQPHHRPGLLDFLTDQLAQKFRR